MNQDDNELNTIMSSSCGMKNYGAMKSMPAEGCCSSPPGVKEESTILRGHVQWTTSDDKNFIPASKTLSGLVPGLYEIMQSNTVGIYFHKIPVRTEGLLRFPQTNSERVIKEIQKFWDREEHFRKYGLTYKRGIGLWGPPGSGKSCTIQIIMSDVVSRGGVILKFTYPGLFLEGFRILRQIQPKVPAVVLMEDMDSIIEKYNESEVLNILDGVDQVENVVFLATTNYPEKLGPRIFNRPSRFDKRFKIDHPNKESRRMYLRHIMVDRPQELGIDLDKWVEDTEGFSLAHLKELFVAVNILGDEYTDALEALRSMKENISSDDDRERMLGFASDYSRVKC